MTDFDWDVMVIKEPILYLNYSVFASEIGKPSDLNSVAKPFVKSYRYFFPEGSKVWRESIDTVSKRVFIETKNHENKDAKFYEDYTKVLRSRTKNDFYLGLNDRNISYWPKEKGLKYIQFTHSIEKVRQRFLEHKWEGLTNASAGFEERKQKDHFDHMWFQTNKFLQDKANGENRGELAMFFFEWPINKHKQSEEAINSVFWNYKLPKTSHPRESFYGFAEKANLN